MTVLTHRRPLRIAVALGLVGFFTAGYAAVAATIVSATEASAIVEVKCVDASQSLWSAAVIVTNRWDGPTTVTVDSSSAASHEVHTLTTNGETWTSHVYETSGTQIGFNVYSDHPEHFTNSVPVSVPRPSGCEAPPTEIPPTPTPLVPIPTTAAPVATTAGPTWTTTPASTTATTTAAATPATTSQAPVTTVARSLPTTGSNDTLILSVGVAALLVGGALLLAGRRGSAA